MAVFPIIRVFLLVSLVFFTLYGYAKSSIPHFDKTNPFPENMHDIFFLTTNLGWAYGYGNGVIYRTKDGGESWQKIADLGVGYFEQIQFVDAKKGVIIGGDKQIYTTTDGGHSWSLSAPLDWQQFDSVYSYGLLVKDNFIFVSSFASSKDSKKRQAVNAISEDFGKTWQVFNNNIHGMFMYVTKDNGLTAVGRGIYRSLDYGRTWQNILETLSVEQLQLRGYQSSNGFAIVCDFPQGLALYTVNNWQSVKLVKVTSNRLRDIAIVDQIIIAVGDANKQFGSVHLSLDNGNSWSLVDSVTQDIHRIAVTDLTIHLVGKGGVYVRIPRAQFKTLK